MATRAASRPAAGTARAWLALGLNLPPHAWRWQRLLAGLDGLRGLRVVRVSPVFVNPAVGPRVRGQFWNAVALVETRLPPLDLLNRLQELEKKLGRHGDGDRPADLDILFWYDRAGWRRMDHPRLRLPHPRWRGRAFVREPLAWLDTAARAAGEAVSPAAAWVAKK